MKKSGEHAHASLLLTLGALSAKVINDATLLIPFVRSKIDADGNITDAGIMQKLQDVFAAFLKEV